MNRGLLALLVDVAWPDWMGDASCRNLDREAWFSTHYADAVEVCSRCPVRVDCLDYALDVEATGVTLHGVWGGVTQYGRRRLRQGVA